MITIETFTKTAGIRKRQQAVIEFNKWFEDNIIKLVKAKPSLTESEVCMHMGGNNGLMEYFSIFSVDKWGKDHVLYTISFEHNDNYQETVTVNIQQKFGKNNLTVVTIPIAELDSERDYFAVRNVLEDYFKN